MVFDSLIELLNGKLLEKGLYPLNRVETLLLQGILDNITYSKLSQQESYSSGYITKVAAPKLYKKLSLLLDNNVSKKNCRQLLKSYADLLDTDLSTAYPSGAVALDSAFYIKRSTIEQKIYQELSLEGALIRIKGSRGTGKTSLLLRVLDYALKRGYKVLSFNLSQIDSELFNDLDRFLRFLCTSASQQLNIASKLDEYWDRDIGSKISCSLYFRYCILDQSNCPVVLAFDELDRIFNHPQLAREFLPLLRSWYEEGKRNSSWQKLRTTIVYSTEIFVPLSVNLSPCNVGLPIELKGLNVEQVKELANRYKLNWQDSDDARLLTNFVGGHPGLIQIALYHLSLQEVTLSEILATAINPEGIYYSHLLRAWLNLQKEPQLAESFSVLLKTEAPSSIEPVTAYKLRGMGLIKPIGDHDIISCELYNRYFTKNSLEINS